MNPLTSEPAFWVVLSVFLYPLLFACFVAFAIMPPLNLVLIPIWFFVTAGAVGGLTSGLDEAKRAQRMAQRTPRR